MLLNSTETDLTFEAGGASPSPDYPSEIENIEGKNKFNKSNMTEATWDNGKTNTVTLLEDGRIQSTANYAQWAAKCIDIPNLKANTNYVVSGKIVSSTAGNAMIIVKGYKNNTLSNIIYRQYAAETKFELSFNSSDYEKIGISLSGNNSTLETIYTTIFDEIQLEEDTVATDYVPYNLLEIKDIGENLYNKKDISGTRMAEVKINELTAGTYTLSALATSSDTDRTQCLVLDATNNKNLGYLNRNVRSSFTFTLEKPTKKLNFYASTTYDLGENDTFKFADIQIEQKTMATSYKPYQEQKVDFPLSEGQKLYKDSYLSSDGIHHKRKQIVLKGTENWAGYAEKTNTVSVYLIMSDLVETQNSNILSNRFQKVGYEQDIEGIVATPYVTKLITIKINKSRLTEASLVGIKNWLETQYSNGTPVIVEYELSEEEIVPYTTAQQEAWDKKESMKLYDGVNHIESTSEIDIKYNYIYKKPSIKNKSNIENKISSGEYQTIINNKRYFVFLEEELKSVRNDITDRLYIDTNKNIAKVMKRVDKLVLNGTEEWNVNATHSNVFYTAKPKNMADNETNIFCTITDEFSKDLSGETYGILIDTNINIKIPKVKTAADLKAYLAKEPITIQYKAIEEIKDIILLSKPSSYWTTCEDEFKYPQMQKTTNKRGCVADVIGEEIDVFCKTNKEQFEKIATHKNATGYAVNRIKKKKWKSIQLKFSSNKSFELFSCTLESYIGSYIKR